MEDGSRGDLEEGLLRRREPVERGDPAERIEAEVPPQPRFERVDVDVMRDGRVVPAEPSRPAAKARWESGLDRRAQPLDFARGDEHLELRSPGVVGRALGVEADHLRAPTDPRRGVRCLADDLRDDLLVVRTGELEPGDEGRHGEQSYGASANAQDSGT